jgi:type III pantothenate kinase
VTTLLLDAGNTRLKWALCSQGEFLQRGSFSYHDSDLLSQFESQWSALLHADLRSTQVKLILSNVAGEQLVSALHDWLLTWKNAAAGAQESSALTIETVQAQAQAFGVRCAYQDPTQLGSDRWAALVAARHRLKGPSCVISCGTALTLDVLSAEGVHLGGMIAPGMTMMRQSLINDTAQVVAADAVTDTIFAAHNTASSVHAGILAASVGAVQHALRECGDRLGQMPRCIVTGGNAEFVLPALPEGSLHDPDWVLNGLAIIAGCQP